MKEKVINSGYEVLRLNTDEYCTILEKNNTSQVKVNKLMPIMGTGKPKDVPYTLPYRMTCNAQECEPIGNRKCVSKNYMTIEGGSEEVYPGDICRVHVINGNINQIKYVEKV